jgi:hypothetical protein
MRGEQWVACLTDLALLLRELYPWKRRIVSCRCVVFDHWIMFIPCITFRLLICSMMIK